MNFQDLHEQLRLRLARSIEEGALTGTRLAQQTGFRQAHISNFLNRRRSLSLEGLDRVLASQGFEIEEILPLGIHAAADRPAPEAGGTTAAGADAAAIRAADGVDAARHTSTGKPPDKSSETVPVVTASAAVGEAVIRPVSVIETACVPLSRLAENRTRVSPRHAGWQRFIAIRPSGQEAAAMHPTFATGTLAVIDRWYNSIAPYRPEEPTLLAIRYGSSLLVRFVELDGDHLILRPSSIDHPLHFVTVAENETAADYIVGRVCLLMRDL